MKTKRLKTHKSVYIYIYIATIFIILFSFLFKFNSYAASSYTTITSTTLLEQNSLSTLELNLTEFPTVTVTGSTDYEITDGEGYKSNYSQARRVTFYTDSGYNGDIDSVVTVLYEDCGTLNGETIDMKLIYSDIAVTSIRESKGEKPFFYWTAYGTEDDQVDENEWWYSDIEHAIVDIYFYYSGSSTPISLDCAYISQYSLNTGEGACSSIASQIYLYENTQEIFASSITSTLTGNTYKNLVYGGENAGSTDEGGNLSAVMFQYKDVDYLEIEILNNMTLENTVARVKAGYHFRFSSLTASVPDDPTKTVSQTTAEIGDTLTYIISQDISSALDDDFYYESLVFEDILPDGVTYKSLTVLSEDNTDVTSLAGSTSVSGQTVTYTFDSDYLENTMSYER